MRLDSSSDKRRADLAWRAEIYTVDCKVQGYGFKRGTCYVVLIATVQLFKNFLYIVYVDFINCFDDLCLIISIGLICHRRSILPKPIAISIEPVVCCTFSSQRPTDDRLSSSVDAIYHRLSSLSSIGPPHAHLSHTFLSGGSTQS